MQIMITLSKIKEKSPCQSGWKKILEAKQHLGMDAEWPLSDALDSNGLDDTLWALKCMPEHSRLWRLYAVWCARQVQHLMTDPRSLAALDVAKRHANGNATDEELYAAGDAAWAAAGAAAGAAVRAAARAAAGAAAWDSQTEKLRQILDTGEV